MARSILMGATVVLFAGLGIVVALVTEYDVLELAFYGGLVGLTVAMIGRGFLNPPEHDDHDGVEPGIAPKFSHELSRADLEACGRGELLLVVRRLRRKAWWILSLSLLMLAGAVSYWLYRFQQSGRFTLLILVVFLFASEGWARFVALRRTANSLEASARRAALR